MNMILKKQNIKLKQKIRFADSATIFLAYRRNMFMIQRSLFAQFFVIFVKLTLTPSIFYSLTLTLSIFLAVDAVNLLPVRALNQQFYDH